MQSENLYQRLCACVNLAVRGATDGEQSSGKASAARIIARLPSEELTVLREILEVSRTKRRKGTKRVQIVEMLRGGVPPKDIAMRVGVKVQYVYNVRRTLSDE